MCVFICFAIFLITLGFGYYVCVKATEETKFLKFLGNAVSAIIIIGSLIGIVYTGFYSFKCPEKKGLCTSKSVVQEIAEPAS